MLLLHLLPQTKSNRNTRAEVDIAHTTLSGLSPGRWCERLSLLLFGTAAWPTSPSPIFLEPDGTPWSSLFFCANFVYPYCLQQLQAGGDPYLLPFQGEGNTISQTSFGPYYYYTCTAGVPVANLLVVDHTLIPPLKLPSPTKSTNMGVGASGARRKPSTNNIVNGLTLSLCI
jgi:hypothetical protein